VVAPSVRVMDLQAEPLQALGPHLVDAETYGYAPMPLYGALIYLNAGEDVAASVCSVRSSEDLVTWRLVWLTNNLLGFASVSKRAPSWDAESPDQVPDDSTAWVRPVRDVAQLGTKLLNHRQVSAITRRWASDPYPTIRWADGTELALPLFDEAPQMREREAIQVFASELRSRLWA
jgi:hypothetical protein